MKWILGLVLLFIVSCNEASKQVLNQLADAAIGSIRYGCSFRGG
jgi:hypothetical protein